MLVSLGADKDLSQVSERRCLGGAGALGRACFCASQLRVCSELCLGPTWVPDLELPSDWLGEGIPSPGASKYQGLEGNELGRFKWQQTKWLEREKGEGQIPISCFKQQNIQEAKQAQGGR